MRGHIKHLLQLNRYSCHCQNHVGLDRIMGPGEHGPIACLSAVINDVAV